MPNRRAYSLFVSISCLLWVGCGTPVDEPDEPGDSESGQIDISTDEPGSGLVAEYDCSALRTSTLVEVEDGAFSPERTTIEKGTVVEWKNRGDAPVTVTSGDESNAGKLFDSRNIPPGSSHCLEFRLAGTFHYYDRHRGSDQLSGVIRVQPDWR